MIRVIATELRRAHDHFRLHGNGWYGFHIAGVFLLSIVVAGGMLWTQQQQVAATSMTPLNNYRAKDFAMIQKDGVWHVFAIYVCISQSPPCDTTPRGLMHLTSSNMVTWTEVGYVVPPGTAGAWDSTDVWAPSVVEKDGTYYMFYTGVKLNGQGVAEQKIGVATSTDLYTWTKSPSNPIFNCATQSWAYWNSADLSGDGAACRDPNVIWDETQHQWMMVMSARSLNDNAPIAHTPTVGLATSTDLLTWNEYGYYTSTNGNVTESPHLIQHNSSWYLFWTDNCSGGRCIKYSSSISAYSGFSVKSNFLPAGASEYASEYYAAPGREYFASVSNNNVGLTFREVAWSGTPFSLNEIGLGTISGTMWGDDSLNGALDSGDDGIDGITVTLYQDTGDGLFDPNVDRSYASTTTGDDPNTVGAQTGYFGYTYVVPGTYWVVIDPSNYSSGHVLENYSITTGTGAKKVAVTDNQTVTDQNVGLGLYRTTWDLLNDSDYVTSGTTMSGGRARVSTTSPAVSWWDTAYLYRMGKTITAGTQNVATTDTVTIPVDLQALVTAGKLQSNYADLRVVYWNGSTNTILDADILNATAIRVRAQSNITAGASDTGYYVYYGNAAASPRGATLANVYRYYSSFNAPNSSSYGSWTNSNSDTHWVVSGNAWNYNQQLNANRFTKDTSMSFALDESVAIEATVNVTSGDAGGLAFIRPETFSDDMYWMNVDATNDRTQFYHWLSGQVGSNVTTTIAGNQSYVARFEYQYTSAVARTLRSYLNQTLVHTESEGVTGYDIWYSGGGFTNNLKTAQIGLSSFNGQPKFDDVKAWRLRDVSISSQAEAAKPTTGSGTLQPLTAQAISFSRLQYFSADTIAQQGTVQFILSNDQGATWLYWNGSDWAISNGTIPQSNTVATIQTNAVSFPAGSGLFLWRAIFQEPGATNPMVIRVAMTSNRAPLTPTIVSPVDGQATSSQPQIRFSSSDVEHEGILYSVDLDTSTNFNSNNHRQFTHTSSQFGWTGQDNSNRMFYSDGTVATLTVGAPLLPGTWYWRVSAIDPQGANRPSTASTISSFVVTTPTSLGTPTIQTSTNAITVRWTTSSAVSSWVQYGLTTSYGSVTSANSGTSHEVTITGVSLGTKYHLRVVADVGNSRTIRSADRLVQVSGTTMSGISVTTTKTTATIRWVTSDAASTKVQYGKTSTKLTSTATSTGLIKQHSITISKLAANTTYWYRLTSIGQSTAQSSVLSWKTKAK